MKSAMCRSPKSRIKQVNRRIRGFCLNKSLAARGLRGYFYSMQNAPAPSHEDSLSSLNTAQWQAVETTEGAVPSPAGAGTGNPCFDHAPCVFIAYQSCLSRANARRDLHQQGRAGNEASRECLLGGAPVEGWWLGTFHALAARMLRRHADLKICNPASLFWIRTMSQAVHWILANQGAAGD